MCVRYETNILYDGKVVRSTRRVQKNIKILLIINYENLCNNSSKIKFKKI